MDESEREQLAVGGGRLGTFVRNRLLRSREANPGLQYEEPESDGLKPELRAVTLTQVPSHLKLYTWNLRRGALIEEEFE